MKTEAEERALIVEAMHEAESFLLRLIFLFNPAVPVPRVNNLLADSLKGAYGDLMDRRQALEKRLDSVLESRIVEYIDNSAIPYSQKDGTARMTIKDISKLLEAFADDEPIRRAS